jgi:hypothetical protein
MQKKAPTNRSLIKLLTTYYENNFQQHLKTGCYYFQKLYIFRGLKPPKPQINLTDSRRPDKLFNSYFSGLKFSFFFFSNA